MSDTKPKIFKSWFMYDTEENRELLKILEEIRRRDGWTFSKLNHEALKDWAKNHYCNPQMDLTKFGSKAKVATSCYCGEPALFEAWNENQERFFLCKKHLTQNKTVGLLKRWREL